jgi:hypothetical protein
MEPSRVPTVIAFTDGLGDRHHTDGPGNEPLEILTLRPDLTSVPAFEFALRERVSRLAGFQHDCYGQIRGVSRLGPDASTLALVSDRVAGDRLSVILGVAERELIPLEIGVGLALIRQLVDAIAVLHEAAREVCHGAIAPERIVITPDARLVLVEHVLGGSLSSLQYSRDRYWKELRVALPPAAGAPHFDRRADVTQIGAIALALITGRPLGDRDYPDRVGEIISRIGAVSASGGHEPLPNVFRAWLLRALQLDPRQSFGSAIDAREELDRVLAETGYAPSPEKLKAFLAQHRVSAGPPAPQIVRPAPAPRVIAITPSSIKRPASSPSVARPQSALRHPEPSRAPRPVATRPVFTAASSPRRRLMVAVALLVVLASMGTLTARSFLAPVELPPSETGTLIVNTYPTGATVVIDGRRRGKTPLSLALTPGEHQLELIGETERRSVPVFILADGHVSQLIQLTPSTPPAERIVAPEPETGASPAPAAAPAETETTVEPGWIALAAPVDVQVYDNGRLLGTGRASRFAAAPGRHELHIVNDTLGYKATRVLTVVAGKVSPLKLEWPKGSLSLNALPWADVSIDGERVGETPLGNVTLPIGPHEVVFRHPELGEERHQVIVTASAAARLSVDLRKK